MQIEVTIENGNIRTGRIAESNVFKVNLSFNLAAVGLNAFKIRVNFRLAFKNFKSGNSRIFSLCEC
jgi:hypothetical protein